MRCPNCAAELDGSDACAACGLELGMAAPVAVEVAPLDALEATGQLDDGEDPLDVCAGLQVTGFVAADSAIDEVMEGLEATQAPYQDVVAPPLAGLATDRFVDRTPRTPPVGAEVICTRCHTVGAAGTFCEQCGFKFERESLVMGTAELSLGACRECGTPGIRGRPCSGCGRRNV